MTLATGWGNPSRDVVQAFKPAVSGGPKGPHYNSSITASASP